MNKSSLVAGRLQTSTGVRRRAADMLSGEGEAAFSESSVRAAMLKTTVLLPKQIGDQARAVMIVNAEDL